mgnify:CR=1 FL=1
MRNLNQIFAGLGILGAVLGQPPAYPETRYGFARDRAALRADMRRVVKTMNQQIHSAYGE